MTQPINYRAVTEHLAATTPGLGPWFVNQINQESGFNPNARSGAGAVGIAQIVPKYHPGVNPLDPVASLNWAAQYMAGLVHKYGSVPKALSVYNSGQPDKYLDPNFAGGQTYNYVRDILGGHVPAVSNAAPAVSSTAPARAVPAAPNGGAIDALLGLAEGGSPESILQNLAVASPARPTAAAVTSPALTAPPVTVAKAGPLKLAFVPAGYTTRAGIQVAKQVLPSVLQIVKQFGVKVNSGFRSAAHNSAVGGASNSDHLRGDAVDFTGSAAQMRALYEWAQGRFPYVEPWDQAKNHVHVSFLR